MTEFNNSELKKTTKPLYHSHRNDPFLKFQTKYNFNLLKTTVLENTGEWRVLQLLSKN